VSCSFFHKIFLDSLSEIIASNGDELTNGIDDLMLFILEEKLIIPLIFRQDEMNSLILSRHELL
jgi:hypothetical protein